MIESLNIDVDDEYQIIFQKNQDDQIIAFATDISSQIWRMLNIQNIALYIFFNDALSASDYWLPNSPDILKNTVAKYVNRILTACINGIDLNKKHRPLTAKYLRTNSISTFLTNFFNCEDDTIAILADKELIENIRQPINKRAFKAGAGLRIVMKKHDSQLIHALWDILLEKQTHYLKENYPTITEQQTEIYKSKIEAIAAEYKINPEGLLLGRSYR